MGSARCEEKSLATTYMLWFFLGIFGAHHFYLGRDVQAFIWWCTLGGYFGCGWLRDAFHIRRYVAEANNDPEFVAKQVHLLKSYSVPPFSVVRFTGMLMVGYHFASLLGDAIPDDPVLGVNWRFLHVLVPGACAFGVWLVGNVGREQGKIWWALAAAYAAYPFSTYFQDEAAWFALMVISSSLAFDNMSKEWRRQPRKRQPVAKRMGLLVTGGLIYLSLWTSSIYYKGELVDSEGERVPLKEALHHFFTSPWWVDLKQSLYEVYTVAKNQGWQEVWRQIIDLSDPHGEINAYKVLGVNPTYSQAEITSRWRALSREFHPDKVKDPERRRDAEAKFMEIQQAYEILSTIKMRRKNKNKKSQN